ncbi:nickel-responsive transcriptional regulator NikR [Xylophilus sp. Kf1]|nr:nickel-responsive transcriptional regulator NikR [Xylophilus sp. Kf1]
MQRLTFSLDDDLAQQFDDFITARGYVNRSEAVRDLIRARIGSVTLAAGHDHSPDGTGRPHQHEAHGPGHVHAPGHHGHHDGHHHNHPQAEWCVANVSYVYDHREPSVTTRVLDLHHDHHDMVVSSVRSYLDHDNCLETAVLRGATEAVRACADQLVALRGVRHGNIHMVPLGASGQPHQHPHGGPAPHVHLKPIN